MGVELNIPPPLPLRARNRHLDEFERDGVGDIVDDGFESTNSYRSTTRGLLQRRPPSDLM